MTDTAAEAVGVERSFAYRILRYIPNLVRDEWVNIGVLVFDPRSGERRLRLIEEQEEYARVRRLHRAADESLLRALRADLESRFEFALRSNGASGGNGLEDLLRKWDETLSNALQFAPQKGVMGEDLDAELERLYVDHVAVPKGAAGMGAPGSRPQMRRYCSQVLRQANLWSRVRKSVPASEFTVPGDPMRIDYGYRRNGTLAFVHCLPVSRAPGDAKAFAFTAEQITAKASLRTEFTAVTDIELAEHDDRDRFVTRTLRESGIEPVPLSHFAVWVAKLKPTIQ